MRPPARLIMKLISSGVASCAAQIRSPSFSRSSSSATMISLPAAISAIACSTVLNGISSAVGSGLERGHVGRHELANILPHHVGFDVHLITSLQGAKRGMARRVLDYRQLKNPRRGEV